MTMLRLAALNAAYAAAIDQDRLEDWPAFFTDDCLYKVTSADNDKAGMQAGIVYADSRAMLRDRITALRTANIYERQAYRHIIGLPLIGAETDGLIEAETPFIVARITRNARTDLFATGIYRDRVLDSGGALHFRQRIVICDSNHFDTLLAIPL
jgi:anthranilate 1,2-dioxygenase small subunit/terephthalate 1,2-dioxygenase oxygenase component beta subunit